MVIFLCGAVCAQTVAPAAASTSEKALFEDMPVVEAAALHAQSLEEAPASVTVITASDIAKYGYRTLGEALAGVRGLYVSYDRAYHYVGVAGFSIPGDYNTRFLVLLNGHPLTENIFNSNGFFGDDFGLEMDLVQRIEVIRGPSSALYGSNGMLATVNIVTKSPVDMHRFSATSETGSFGEKKAGVSASVYFGNGANLLVSASVFNDSGQNFFFPEFDSRAMNYGRANGVDGQRGYHTFADLVWKDWNITAYFNSREKQMPVPWGPSIFPDTGDRIRDSRNFIAALYTRNLGADRQLRWQLYYDNYRYDDRFDYDAGGGSDGAGIQDIRTRDRGDWAGSELTYRFQVNRQATLTLGAQADFELRNLQEGYQASPEYALLADINKPDRKVAVFAQQEWTLSARWKASFGLRFDESTNFGHFLSPRVALVYQYSPRTTYKFIYGRPYRNPSTAEAYYADGGYASIANPKLRQETANTFEMSGERRLGKQTTILADFYQYRIAGLISAVTVAPGVQQYQNEDREHSTGIEIELRGKLRGNLEAAGSFSYDIAKTSFGDGTFPNSPRKIGKLRFSKPIIRSLFALSSSTQYMGRRETVLEAVTRPVLLEDLTLTTRRLNPDFDIQFGVRNALNWSYRDPVYVLIDQMRQDGRSLYLKLVWHTRE